MAGWHLDADSPLLALGRQAAPGAVPGRPAWPGRARRGARAPGGRGRGRPHPAAGHAQGRVLGERPRRDRLSHPPAGPRAAPAGRPALARPGPVRPARWLGGAPAPGGARPWPTPPTCRCPGLFIGATHTHAGPGQFLGTDFYNRFASNRVGLRPGLDPVPRRPDRRWRRDRGGDAATGAAGQRIDRGLGADPQPLARATRAQRRRSPTNGPSPSASSSPSTPSSTSCGSTPTRADGGTRAARPRLVVFSVHGTGISDARPRVQRRPLGVPRAASCATAWSSAPGSATVVGAMQGTHADVAPAIRPGAAGYLEAQRIGPGIGEMAAELHARPGGRALERGHAAPRAARDRAGALARDRRHRAPGPTGGGCGAGGRCDREHHAGHRRSAARSGPAWASAAGPGNPQGAKWVVGIPLAPAFDPAPQRHSPGPAGPADLGRRVEHRRHAVRDHAWRPAVASRPPCSHRARRGQHVVVSSVANEYSGYVATAEEYALQYYEGGHTLYGPKTQRVPGRPRRPAGPRPRARWRGPRRVRAARQFDLHLHRYLPRLPSSAARDRGKPAHRRRTSSTPRRRSTPTGSSNGWTRRRATCPGMSHSCAWSTRTARVASSRPSAHRPRRRRPGMGPRGVPSRGGPLPRALVRPRAARGTSSPLRPVGQRVPALKSRRNHSTEGDPIDLLATTMYPMRS